VKGSVLEYILVNVPETATVVELAGLVASRWLEEGPFPVLAEDEAWGIQIFTQSNELLAPERSLQECAAETKQPDFGFWGDRANSQDFYRAGVQATRRVSA
jgi:hypothetical protein